MAQPTVFVQVERVGRQSDSSSALEQVIGLLAKSAGALVVDKLVDDQDVEADIAVAITLESALRFLKETEHTIVFIGYLGTTGSYASAQEAQAFAARFPERVKAGPFVEAEGEENLMIMLMRTIAEMGKENK